MKHFKKKEEFYSENVYVVAMIRQDIENVWVEIFVDAEKTVY